LRLGLADSIDWGLVVWFGSVLFCFKFVICFAHPLVYHNFLSPAECEEIIAFAEPHMERSTVVNSDGKISTDSCMHGVHLYHSCF
jgi:hypothetical protein